LRPAPEKFIKFITFITFITFAIFEPFIQILTTVTRQTCHAEEGSFSVGWSDGSQEPRFFACGLRMTL